MAAGFTSESADVTAMPRHFAELDAHNCVSPIVASAIAATILDPRYFRSSREFVAWLGLFPRQSSSGGKERLGRISDREIRNVRKLLVIRATAVLRYGRTKTSGNEWLRALLDRKPARLVTVALAYKMARTAWRC
ncbi:transposase [Mesorhizobium sp. M0207]|uniref:transposase n=1 Tax=Mesorhizobium sp. M0207 TaxID=2956915 RepID=UPI003339D67E